MTLTYRAPITVQHFAREGRERGKTTTTGAGDTSTPQRQHGNLPPVKPWETRCRRRLPVVRLLAIAQGTPPSRGYPDYRRRTRFPRGTFLHDHPRRHIPVSLPTVLPSLTSRERERERGTLRCGTLRRRRRSGDGGEAKCAARTVAFFQQPSGARLHWQTHTHLTADPPGWRALDLRRRSKKDVHPSRLQVGLPKYSTTTCSSAGHHIPGPAASADRTRVGAENSLRKLAPTPLTDRAFCSILLYIQV